MGGTHISKNDLSNIKGEIGPLSLFAIDRVSGISFWTINGGFSYAPVGHFGKDGELTGTVIKMEDARGLVTNNTGWLAVASKDSVALFRTENLEVCKHLHCAIP